jgi:hypothetical protein
MYSSAEVGAASLIISIKHSLKNLKDDMKFDHSDLNSLKNLYSKWTFTIFTKYKLDLERVSEFTKLLKVFLAKV